MNVLVVYAHPIRTRSPTRSSKSVTKGSTTARTLQGQRPLRERLRPVFTASRRIQFVHESLPDDLLEEANPREAVLDAAGGPIRRFMARRWLRDRRTGEIARRSASTCPRTCGNSRRWSRSRGADLRRPGVLDGLPGDPQGLVRARLRLRVRLHPHPRGLAGRPQGRVPLLSQQKALIVTPTFFTEEEYDKGWRDAMDTVLCDWGLKMAGVKETSTSTSTPWSPPTTRAAGVPRRGLPAGKGLLRRIPPGGHAVKRHRVIGVLVDAFSVSGSDSPTPLPASLSSSSRAVFERVSSFPATSAWGGKSSGICSNMRSQPAIMRSCSRGASFLPSTTPAPVISAAIPIRRIFVPF